MTHLRISPGPDAAAAFRLGTLGAGLSGLVVIAGLYWAGVVDALLAGYLLLLGFPVYLVLAASVLSVWLGYGKDARSLRPVQVGPDGTVIEQEDRGEADDGTD